MMVLLFTRPTDRCVAQGRKCDLINRRSWRSLAEARPALFTWIEGWYNSRHRHYGLEYQTRILRKHQLGRHALALGPAQHFAADGIDHHCRIQEARPSGDVRDFGQTQLVGHVCSESALDQIGRRPSLRKSDQGRRISHVVGIADCSAERVLITRKP